MKKSSNRIMITLIMLILGAGCTSDPDPPGKPSVIDSGQIVEEVEAAVWRFHAADTAKDAEGVIDLLWPEYTMLVDGSRLGYSETVSGSKEFMATLKLFHTDWSDLEIIPLEPDAAVASFMFCDSIVTISGEVSRSRGVVTFVWQRRDGEWRVRFADADHYVVDP